MASSFDPARIVFLDIEASGLGEGSFPVEVGWAFLTGGSGSLLIRPEPDWDLTAWDEAAEALHGLALQQLRKEGQSARDVAETLNRLLGRSPPLLVLSDAPEVDGVWLRCLYEATPQLQDFELQHEMRARELILGAGQVLPGGSADAPDPPLTHRAVFDAWRLTAIWRQRLGLPPLPPPVIEAGRPP